MHQHNELAASVDEALIERAKAGSTAAFDQLVRRHQASIRAFLRRFVQEPSLADDLAQETFIKAWQSLSQWRGISGREVSAGGSFRGWLFSIACSRAKDSRRSQQRAQTRETNWLAEQDGPIDMQAAAQIRLDLTKVMARLAPDQAMVVSLCYGAGLSHGEAAQALKMPLGTVKSHAARGRDRMLAMLQAKDSFGASQPPSAQDGN